MPLQPGTQLRPYQVTAKIGLGGMGEVYQGFVQLFRSFGSAVVVGVASYCGSAGLTTATLLTSCPCSADNRPRAFMS